jgi:cell division protein DivIC
VENTAEVSGMSQPFGEQAPAKKRKRRKFKFTARFWVICLCVIGVYLSILYGIEYYKILSLRQEAREIKSQLQQLLEQNEALQVELEYYQSEEYIEGAARSELGLVKPGETAIVVAEPAN